MPAAPGWPQRDFPADLTTGEPSTANLGSMEEAKSPSSKMEQQLEKEQGNHNNLRATMHHLWTSAEWLQTSMDTVNRNVNTIVQHDLFGNRQLDKEEVFNSYSVANNGHRAAIGYSDL